MKQQIMFEINEELLDDMDIDEESREKIEKIREYDLSFLTERFNDEQIEAGRPYSVEQVYPIRNLFGKADYEVAKLLEVEFRKFVALTLIDPGVPHAPAGAIDMYWHFFILHTEEYMNFCEEVWGSFENQPGYRHHYPVRDETRAGQLQAYSHTRDLYDKAFGETPILDRPGGRSIDVWTEVGVTSGDSYSGIVEPEEVE